MFVRCSIARSSSRDHGESFETRVWSKRRGGGDFSPEFGPVSRSSQQEENCSRNRRRRQRRRSKRKSEKHKEKAPKFSLTGAPCARRLHTCRRSVGLQERFVNESAAKLLRILGKLGAGGNSFPKCKSARKIWRGKKKKTVLFLLHSSNHVMSATWWENSTKVKTSTPHGILGKRSLESRPA